MRLAGTGDLARLPPKSKVPTLTPCLSSQSQFVVVLLQLAAFGSYAILKSLDRLIRH
jgi:hypothetical protein